MKLLSEFKAFAMRGNVVDMAVGVIMGGAFGKIVSSVVADVIMPPIGKLVGGVNFTDLSISLGKSADEKTDVVIGYGKFLQATFDFLIVAFCIFMVVKAMNALKKKEPPPAPAGPTPSEQLLAEIRDLLKSRPAK